VMRQADAGGGDGGEQLVGPAPMMDRGDKAADDAKREAEHGGQDCQDEGVGERGDKLAPYGGRVEDRQSKIAAQRPAEPQQVLDVEWLIEAEGGLHLRDDLG